MYNYNSGGKSTKVIHVKLFEILLLLILPDVKLKKCQFAKKLQSLQSFNTNCNNLLKWSKPKGQSSTMDLQILMNPIQEYLSDLFLPD